MKFTICREAGARTAMLLRAPSAERRGRNGGEGGAGVPGGRTAFYRRRRGGGVFFFHIIGYLDDLFLHSGFMHASLRCRGCDVTISPLDSWYLFLRRLRDFGCAPRARRRHARESGPS